MEVALPAAPFMRYVSIRRRSHEIWKSVSAQIGITVIHPAGVLKYSAKVSRITLIQDWEKEDFIIRIILIRIPSFEILGPGDQTWETASNYRSCSTALSVGISPDQRLATSTKSITGCPWVWIKTRKTRLCTSPYNRSHCTGLPSEVSQLQLCRWHAQVLL